MCPSHFFCHIHKSESVDVNDKNEVTDLWFKFKFQIFLTTRPVPVPELFVKYPSHPEVKNHYPSGPGWGTRLLIKLITIATPASSCLLIQVYNAYFFTFGILFGNPFGVVHNFVDQWQILIHTVGSEAIKSDGLRIAVSRLLPTTNSRRVEDKTASGNVNVSLYQGKCNSVWAQPINMYLCSTTRGRAWISRLLRSENILRKN